MFAEIDQKNSKIAYIETKLNEQIAFLNVKIQEKSNEINFLNIKIQEGLG